MMPHKNRYWAVLLLTGAAAGLGIAWFMRARRKQLASLPQAAGLPARKMLLFAVSQRMLSERRGADRAKILMETMQKKYADLCQACPIPTHPAMRKHLYENMLPGLALYQVLLAEYEGDRQAALAEVDQIFRAWTIDLVRPKLAPIKSLPVPFGLFKVATNVVMKNYPAEGWDLKVTENSPERMALNITRCFYLNTLTTLGAPELTASFCKGDDVMAEFFPASVRFVRPHTLGRGDTVCDFQYCRAR